MKKNRNIMNNDLILGIVLSLVGALITIFGGLKVKDGWSQLSEKPVKLTTNSSKVDIPSITYNLKNSVLGDGNIVTYNESLEEQQIKKIDKYVNDFSSNNPIVVEAALRYLKNNPEFNNRQIDIIFENIKLAKFNNRYQEDFIWLLAQRESPVATKYFGESLPWAQYHPAIAMEYFSKNNIDYNVFTKYMRTAIISTIDKTIVHSIVINNSAYNKDYILKFLNSKELIDLIFKDLHPNYIQRFKLSINNNEALSYISKKDFEDSYFYKRIAQL
jgi:hypothetical protein